MPVYLIDENLPRSLARSLARAGIEAIRVIDLGLRGHPDLHVYLYAVASGLVLVTADKGFGDIRKYPLHEHRGIVICRLPTRLRRAQRIALITEVLLSPVVDAFRGGLLIISPARIRVRNPQ